MVPCAVIFIVALCSLRHITIKGQTKKSSRTAASLVSKKWKGCEITEILKQEQKFWSWDDATQSYDISNELQTVALWGQGVRNWEAWPVSLCKFCPELQVSALFYLIFLCVLWSISTCLNVSLQHHIYYSKYKVIKWMSKHKAYWAFPIWTSRFWKEQSQDLRAGKPVSSFKLAHKLCFIC